MNNQPNVFFFEIQPISEDSLLFQKFQQEKIFFSYFQVDQNYYLFLYGQKSIDIDFLYQSVDVIQELDSKERKIRSLRGFFLYALEIMENGYEILETNLQPFFWRKVKNIIRQNKKGALLEFLFGSEKGDLEFKNLKEEIKELKAKINSLHQKITDLENEIENFKSLSEASRRLHNPSSTTDQ